MKLYCLAYVALISLWSSGLMQASSTKFVFGNSRRKDEDCTAALLEDREKAREMLKDSGIRSTMCLAQQGTEKPPHEGFSNVTIGGPSVPVIPAEHVDYIATKLLTPGKAYPIQELAGPVEEHLREYRRAEEARAKKAGVTYRPSSRYARLIITKGRCHIGVVDKGVYPSGSELKKKDDYYERLCQQAEQEKAEQPFCKDPQTIQPVEQSVEVGRKGVGVTPYVENVSVQTHPGYKGLRGQACAFKPLGGKRNGFSTTAPGKRQRIEGNPRRHQNTPQVDDQDFPVLPQRPGLPTHQKETGTGNRLEEFSRIAASLPAMSPTVGVESVE